MRRRLTALLAAALALVATPAYAEEPEDLTPPVITITPAAGGVGGWYAAPTDVFAKATDPGRIATGVVWLNYQLSGATTGTGNLHRTTGGTVTISNTGLTTIDFEAIDGNDNHTQERIQVGVDQVRPSVEFGGRMNLPDPVFAQGEAESLFYSCADSHSGITSCTDSQPSESLDTSTIGTHTVTVTARDRVGNQTQVSRTYKVVSNQFVVTQGADVNGAVGVGRQVTVRPPVFEPVPAFITYQWTRDGVPITGAGGTSYTLKPEDARSTLRVEATANRSGWESRTVVSPGYVVAPAVITISSQPTLSGEARVGGSLHLGHGSFNPATVAVSYQWLRDGVLIPTASGRTYYPDASDMGHRITARVAATAPGHTEGVWLTTPSDVVLGRTLEVTGTPAVTGTAQAGSLLTAQPPTVRVPFPSRSGEPAAVAFQWLRDGTPIGGATQATYRLSGDDVGSRVTVRMTATRPPEEGYEPVVLTSAPGPSVVKATPVVTGQAKASGKRKVKLTVLVSVPGLDPTAPVTVTRGSKVVAKATVNASGRLVLKLKRQPKGKVTWTVAYAGSRGVAAHTVQVSAKVR